VDELVSHAGRYVVWQFDRPEEGRRLLEGENGVRFVDEHEHRIDESVLAGLKNALVTAVQPDRIPVLVEKAVRAGIGVISVQQIAPTLEQLFLNMTEGETIG
jgi:ABC-2 type transport system ATP-binding protein